MNTNPDPQEANDADIVFDQVFACVFSGLEFQTNSKIVFENIASNNQRYIDDALVSIYEVLVSPDCPPIAKFYALYLLVRATETNNLLLAGQLSKYKDLLQKIFQDAQTDKDKSFPEKGVAFFSKEPSQEEALIGANYIRLCLEALKFWSNSFGTPDKQTSLSMFNQMYTKLAERIKFPETFFYIGKTHQTTTDFHLKQEPTRDKSPGRQQSSPPKPNTEENAKVYQQVLGCVKSGIDYKNNSKAIFETLAQQKTSEYSQRLLASIIEVLESPDFSPKNKFYALFLLVQGTETKNAAFLSAVSQKKSLLNKFYKDVKAEGDKDPKIRGQTLFPTIANTPEAIIGRNYVNLLIEAIKYWDSTYGNVESTNSLSHFKTLYNSLAKLVQFPQTYSYISQKIDPEGLRGAKSLSRVEILAEEPEEGDEEQVDKSQIARDHVNACLASGRTFKPNFNLIMGMLAENPPGYIDAYFKSILDVLSAPLEAPLRRFYAVFLLIKSTETKNDALINALASSRSLLNKVFQDGQFDKHKDFNERGRTFFSKEPTYEQKVIGNCYVTLVLEALVFWHTHYAKESKKEPAHIFKVMFDALSQKNFRFPTQNYYIGVDINTILSDIERRLNKSEASTPQKDRSVSPNLNSPITSPPKTIPETKSTPPVDKKAIEATLEKYETAKAELKDMLVNSPEESEENEELLEFLVEDVKQIYGTDVQIHVKVLVANEDPDLNVYVNKILEEHDIVQSLTANYNNYTSKKMSYLQFRKETLGLLGITVSSSQTPHPIGEKPEPQVQPVVQEQKPAAGDLKISTNPSEDKKSQEEGTTEKTAAAEEQKSPPESTKSNSMKKLTLKSPRKEKMPLSFPINTKAVEEDQNIRANTVGSEMSESHKRYVEDPITVTDLPKGQDMQSFSFKESARESIPSHRGDNKVLGSMHSEGGQSDKKLSTIQRNPTIKEEDSQIRTGSDKKEAMMETTFKSPSKSKISEESLNKSLRNIAQSISNTKAVELGKIEDSIKSSYMASGKKPPTFQPLKELKKKEDLEREIEQLKKERLELSRQTNTLRSQIMEGSKDEDDRTIQVASRVLNESRRGEPVVEEYQQKIQDLQGRLDDTSIRLKHRENELNQLRKITEGTHTEEAAKMAQENAELKIKVEQLSKEKSIGSGSDSLSSPDRRQNRQLKNQVQELTKKNQTLLHAVENFKSPGRSREIDLLKISNSPSKSDFSSPPQKTTTVSQTRSGFTTNGSESRRERDLTGKEKVLEKGRVDVEHSRGFVMVSPSKSIRTGKTRHFLLKYLIIFRQ